MKLPLHKITSLHLFECPNKLHCAYRYSHAVGHGIYFAAAFAEGKGIYSMISLALLGIMILGIALHEEG